MSGTAGAGSVAEQILGRLNALETQVADLQLNDGTVDGRSMETQFAEFRTAVNEMRDRLDRMPNVPGGFQRPFAMNSKDTLPEILSTNFKDKMAKLVIQDQGLFEPMGRIIACQTRECRVHEPRAHY